MRVTVLQSLESLDFTRFLRNIYGVTNSVQRVTS
jgi:hypothetical protein